MTVLFPGPGLSFDGRVGDLGSKPGSTTTYDQVFKGHGEQSQFKKWCYDQVKGKEILSDRFTMEDDAFVMTFRLRSGNGI